MIEYFTKWYEAIPLQQQDTKSVTAAILIVWVCHYGAPTIINSSLILRDFHLPIGAGTTTYDISTGHERPFISATLRRQVFNVLHGLSHPELRMTVKSFANRFIWHNINWMVAFGHDLVFHANKPALIDILHLQ
ncbi:unnamed protein product [Dibothriocephalus latus]|uniref:Integrase zinc-binding domain-containing protein n=1 Tax=Dibothriocephalus latus TaxID=60516 RepID=A0A3P7NXW4_DIBLA|nr:unnamed protein product [Dibothriocephalus latus]